MEKEFNPYVMHPCPDCPFRTDCMPGWLGRERAAEIAEQTQSISFTCHETNDHSEDGPLVTQASRHCAGAALVLLKNGQRNASMMLSHALEIPHYRDIRGEGLVFDSLGEFIDHHTR